MTGLPCQRTDSRSEPQSSLYDHRIATTVDSKKIEYTDTDIDTDVDVDVDIEYFKAQGT